MFRVGQKVVCINNKGLRYSIPNEPRVLEGAIYTVSAVDVRFGLPVIRTEETWHDDRNPFSWLYARRFRPLVETKTDISIFQKMLTPKKEKSNVC